MYSDAYVTDFDSDDDNNGYIAWPRGCPDDDDDDDDGDDDDSSVSTLKLQPAYGAQRVREFGEFEDNHGWIQCPSKSFLGRRYFHNMHSGCDTWCRPVSRYVDVPFVCVRRVNCADDPATNDLELMAVSDNEKEPTDSRTSARVSDVITRCYYTPQVDLTSDTSDRVKPVRAFTNGYRNGTGKADASDENNNRGADDGDNNDARTECSSLHATNYLEIDFSMGEDETKADETVARREFDPPMNDDASAASSSYVVPRRVVYTVPRLKKIDIEDQMIKWRETRAPIEKKGPRRIICDMYGVRTISYDLPDENTNEMRTELGVKSSRLSESESENDGDGDDVNESSSRFNSNRWCDKSLRRPSLSDSSSSPSSRSDASSSSASRSTSPSPSPSTSPSTSTSFSSSSSSSSRSCSCSSTCSTCTSSE